MTDKDGKLVWFGDYYGWGKLKSGNERNGNGASTLPIAKHPCPHWYVVTAKMDGNLSQKRNNGNGTFFWKYYKDNVTVQHRK